MTNKTIAAAVLGLSMTFAGSALAIPKHPLPQSKDGNLVVGLCDGKTTMEVPGTRPGDPLTEAQSRKIADALMASWKLKHPNAHWVEAQAARGTTEQRPNKSGSGRVKTQGPNANLPIEGVTRENVHIQGQTYGAFGKRDEAIWMASTQKVVDQGNAIFHSSKLLGGSIGVSCDMCHPNAANTHPETYPKYQVQLGRVAMLRDMINWCIENPVRGRPLPDDSPKLKALEAYIYAQRKGVPLNYGQH